MELGIQDLQSRFRARRGPHRPCQVPKMAYGGGLRLESRRHLLTTSDRRLASYRDGDPTVVTLTTGNPRVSDTAARLVLVEVLIVVSLRWLPA